MLQNGERSVAHYLRPQQRQRQTADVIPKLKSKLKKGTSIIGFLSHVQGDLKQKAHEVGCDMVLPRSAFSRTCPSCCAGTSPGRQIRRAVGTARAATERTSQLARRKLPRSLGRDNSQSSYQSLTIHCPQLTPVRPDRFALEDQVDAMDNCALWLSSEQTRTVRRLSLTSSGETTRHGRVFLISDLWKGRRCQPNSSRRG